MLVDKPDADDAAILEHVTGPDFPTGGLVVDPAAVIAESYRTGRGAFRVRARWSIEREKGGGWQVVVSEIPYGVQKGKLIEGIAELINAKRLPILADVRDESDAEIRLVLEPRSRTVDPAADDGWPVPPDRARDADQPEPQRARQGSHAAGDEPARGARRVGRAPVRGAAPAYRASPRQDRRPDRAARWLSARVPQPRSRDRDHPHRGRAQGRDDGRVQPDRSPGGGDPEHAAALAPAPGGIRDQDRARQARQGTGGPCRAARRSQKAACADEA